MINFSRCGEFFLWRIIAPTFGIAFISSPIWLPILFIVTDHGWDGVLKLILAMIALMIILIVLIYIIFAGYLLAKRFHKEEEYKWIMGTIIGLTIIVIAMISSDGCPAGTYGDAICNQ